ncbi:MAG TPA: carboxypeptidase regulatory-like domain-containing protein [Candidatus Sulfotelmatobacter sp.]|jgi:hypothetical protein|nr:carboxypeptidase regulatory-like domain-containing protein [Candidatus Sulfotelmatobacter sp.]
MPSRQTCVFCALVAVALLLGGNAVFVPTAHAQAGISTGTIQGTVLDPHGGAVVGAKITITSRATAAKIASEVTSTGTYNSGPLVPGEYVVRIEAAGFKAVEQTLTVQTGNITPGSITLELGSESTVVTVEGTSVAVNTEQPTIQGVVTANQIENLPINGRNFLDLAQLEPGVQIQDGGDFDPTKKGFSSISFGGRFGRTARIEVDGLDISDETVGTTTQNVPVNSIKEFQVSQSSLDLATELTSSGTVNITTISGTNTIHGEGFFNYRSDGTSAAIGDPASVFNRKQYGVNLGGPIIKDKLFAFGSWERTTQDLLASVVVQDPFSSLNGNFNSPFRDQQYLGRVDYNVTSKIRTFVKYGFEQNRNVASFVPGTYQPFANVDYTPSVAGGVDFSTGSWTHSFRAGYLKFRNGITDAVAGTNIINPAPGLALAIGNVSTSCTTSGDLFCAGANILAPQKTYQTNKQFKYDGSKIFHSHIIRYGTGVNRILGGGFASFFGIDPAVRGAFTTASQAAAATGPFPGGDSNPLNYGVTRIVLGNGEGCFTEIAQFGQPCGGQYDTRFQAYLGDSWKIKPNLTLTFGVRYNRDTGRSDSDLPPIPCSDAPSVGCTGNLFDAIAPGLGGRVNQPDANVGGMIGFAWDPWKNGKTAIRAGAGIYYENGVFNNVLFDRPARLSQGLFNGTASPCPSGVVALPNGTNMTSINGKDIATQICNQPIGNSINDIIALQQSFQAATVAAGAQSNGLYAANALEVASALTGTTLYAPNYQSPRSYQMNVGIERELRPGTTISIDYLRNVGVHTLLAVDENHVGDANFLDVGGATNAIAATLAQCGVTTINASIAGCPLLGGRPATIADYAANGLTSGTLGGPGGGPSGTGAVAFPGQNSAFGVMQFLQPAGRSVYNGMDVVLRSDLKSPVSFIHRLNAQVSYSLSRLNSMAQDVDFINGALDYNNPTRFFGPGSLDRTNQFSAGVIMELPAGIRANFITHFYTALPQTLVFPTTGNPEDLLQLDTVGDGQTGIAPVPGSNVGSFGRSISPGDLNNFLNQYSSQSGNQLTPAGQALVSKGLFTQAQLQGLCAITPSLAPMGNCASEFPSLQLQPAPNGQVGNGNFFTFDLRLGWSIKPIHAWERFRIEPQVAFYNLFNHKNYNGPTSLLSGVLDGAAGSVNGTTKANLAPNEIGLGSGVFSLGAPRSMEFGIKVSF